MGKYLDFINTISEAKQVGFIYHFTPYIYIDKIISDNKLKNSEEYNYISFTRNGLLNHENSQIRIVFDGNKMSNKFKFEPFNFWYNNKNSKRKHDENEFEERIKTDNGIEDINKYIIEVGILQDNIPDRKLQIIINNLENNNIPYKLYDGNKFTTVYNKGIE